MPVTGLSLAIDFNLPTTACLVGHTSIQGQLVNEASHAAHHSMPHSSPKGEPPGDIFGHFRWKITRELGLVLSLGAEWKIRTQESVHGVENSDLKKSIKR